MAHFIDEKVAVSDWGNQQRGAFPTDNAAIKLLYLGLRHIGKRWTMSIQNWKQAMSQLMIRFNKQCNHA